jgi:eukaryotic translation initiation factor 2C
MLLGADISHPNVLTKIKRSITGVCGSMDLSATTYIGRSSVQKEIHNPTIEALEELVIELLFNYRERNQFLPQRILYYRAGLTPSQFRETLNAEIISLKAAFAKTYEINMPKLTFIIAEKSNHTRQIINKIICLIIIFRGNFFICLFFFSLDFCQTTLKMRIDLEIANQEPL